MKARPLNFHRYLAAFSEIHHKLSGRAAPERIPRGFSPRRIPACPAAFAVISAPGLSGNLVFQGRNINILAYFYVYIKILIMDVLLYKRQGV